MVKYAIKGAETVRETHTSTISSVPGEERDPNSFLMKERGHPKRYIS